MRSHNLAFVTFVCVLAALTRAQSAVSQTANIVNQNFTGGFNNLSYSGALNLGDIDYLAFEIIPASNGIATVAYDEYWGMASTSPPYNRWLDQKLYFPGGFIGSDLPTAFGNGQPYFSLTTPLFTYFAVWSTSPAGAGLTSATGSTVAGTYSITNLRGLNGTLVRAVPEPSSIAFLISAALTATALLRRRKQMHSAD